MKYIYTIFYISLCELEDFSQDFSIIVKFRATEATNSSLLTLYNKELEKVVLSLKISKNSTTFLVDGDKENQKYSSTFEVAVADGK